MSDQGRAVETSDEENQQPEPAAEPSLWRHARWFEPHTARPERVEWSSRQQRWLATCKQEAGPILCNEVLYLRDDFRPEDQRRGAAGRW